MTVKIKNIPGLLVEKGLCAVHDLRNAEIGGCNCMEISIAHETISLQGERGLTLNREKLDKLITNKFEVDGERIADAIISALPEILEVTKCGN